MSAIQQALLSFGSNQGTISLFAISSSAAGLSDFGENASAAATLEVLSNTIYINSNALGNNPDTFASGLESYAWLSGGSSNLYSVKLDVTGSSFDIGSTAINTWVPLTSSIFWGLSTASNQFQRFNSKSITGTLSFALSSNLSNVLASTTVSISISARTNGNTGDPFD